MQTQNIIGLLVAIIVAQGAGGLGAVFNIKSIPTWYKTQKKSKLNPPNWVFGPVWTTLFLLMGIASFLVWQHGLNSAGVKMALIVYLVQLVLNVLWSALFFGARKPGWAFVEILFLWLVILFNIITFWQVSPVAGWLLVPYILWVSFASFLNLQFWQLNRP